MTAPRSPGFPAMNPTPEALVRDGLMLLMNPHWESHGVRIFTVQQVADMSRLFWRAVNQLEGRSDG